MAKDYQMSFSLITKFIEEYQLKSPKSLEEITQIFNILLAMARSTEFIPGDLTTSVDYIIDTVIDELFE
ncbi:hypothetical protein [Desulfosporosinus sp. FKB]|uniref:hypothetical protein n=1 Tax=Desulfosporosinus sp. FKB TaxID=1969835 RepID=UPI0014821420|nr:hypothetical protein [Desulfosporosinus sp. FKB]